jgi:hypothetical protein
VWGTGGWLGEGLERVRVPKPPRPFPREFPPQNPSPPPQNRLSRPVVHLEKVGVRWWCRNTPGRQRAAAVNTDPPLAPPLDPSLHPTPLHTPPHPTSLPNHRPPPLPLPPRKPLRTLDTFHAAASRYRNPLLPTHPPLPPSPTPPPVVPYIGRCVTVGGKFRRENRRNTPGATQIHHPHEFSKPGRWACGPRRARRRFWLGRRR